jgi:hypothetical protein
VAALRAGLGGQAEAVKRHVLTADDATALAEAVVGAVDDVARLDAMQAAAFEAASAHYDWAANGCALKAAIAEAGAR